MYVQRYVQYKVLVRRTTKVKPVKIAIETATKNDHPIWYDSVSWEEPNENVISALVSSVAGRIKKATKFESSEKTLILSLKKYEETMKMSG